MPESTKQQARRLFMELADLADPERTAALALACGDDATLRAEVEALLRADRSAGGFLSSPTAADARQATTHSSPASSEKAGAQIGRYKLLEQIGEGGMGTIWMAEQREPVKRRVALKIIKLGMDTRQVIARFEAERQALAMMDHPHIAKVFDAGATDAGRPYFVMEYIKGIPILDYCDQAKLDTEARLGLFTAVCHAIQHAHQKGIIHRDIKPDNVLVTLHDGVPVCKVIDFGIAKATNSELTTKTLFTEHRQMIGTPAYMSPEQAEMSGLDIDTRSDIYSLGVLLYELLTGTTPFDMKTLLESGFAEMLRTIREVEPHKPSTRISTLGETASRTALQRHVDVRKLGALLRGDLDWIVMKCLEKDRSRRYETANGLAADIQRHLQNEPVTAGAPGAGYRLRKFVKRNRGQVIAGIAVAAALLIGIVAFAWQAKAARHQRDLAVLAKDSEAEQRQLADDARAEAETQATRAREQEAEARKQEAEAKRQAAIAEAISKFQTDMLAAADPDKLLGDKVTVVQAMEAAVEELDKGSLADQPMVEAGVRNTIGSTFQALSRYDVAEPNLRKSLSICRAALPAGHLSIATALNQLAGLLQEQNKLDEAEPLYREALEIKRAAHPAGHPNIASSQNNLALLLMAQNKLAEAEPLLREAMASSVASLPANHPSIAIRLDNLAKLLQAQSKLDEAEPLFREALTLRRAALPAGHPDIALGLNGLGVILQDQNKFDEAEPILREALEISRAALPAGHRNLASSVSNLAIVLQDQHKLDEAEPLMREALEISRAALPAGHPQIATELGRLASLLQQQNKFDEAEPLMREALEISRAALPAGHPQIATELGRLASLLRAQNKLDEAEPLYREALAISRASGPTGHELMVACLTVLGHLHWSQGKFDQSVPMFEEALAAREASRGRQGLDTQTIVANLGVNYAAAGRLAAAIPLLEEAFGASKQHPQLAWVGTHLVRACARAADPANPESVAKVLTLVRELLADARRALPKGGQEVAHLLLESGRALRRLNAWTEAEPLYRELLDISRAELPAGHPDIARLLGELAESLQTRRRLDEAEPLYREALEILRAALPAGHPDVAIALGNLGNLYGLQGRFDQSVPLFEEVVAARAASLGRQHPATQGALGYLGWLYKATGRLAAAIPVLEEVFATSKRHPELAWVGVNLLNAYTEAADPAQPQSVAKVAALRHELLAEARGALPDDSPQLAHMLAVCGSSLLELHQCSEAERLMREALTIRERSEPDSWTTCHLKSELGAALLGQENLAEATPLLLDGYRGMKEREATLWPRDRIRVLRALERLVQLYEATGDASEAAAWRSELEAERARQGNATPEGGK